MFFWVKKLLGFAITPLVFCLATMTIGLLLARLGKRPQLARILVVGGLVLLMLCSNKYVSRLLIRPIEAQYPPIPELTAGAPLPPRLAACRYLVVLGGGNGLSPDMPATGLLSSSALGRIVEAVRLLRVLPAAKLVVCGPGDGVNATHATVLARAAQSLGINPDRVVYIETVRDTEDEAHAARRVIGDAPMALVTSAWHMPRAMALFRHVGFDPVACPADFVSHTYDPFHLEYLLWDLASLQRSTVAVREHVGYLWISLRQKT